MSTDFLPGWKSIELNGKRVDLFSPAIQKNSFALLFLHPLGLEFPSINPAYTQAFQDAGVRVLAPFGGTSWWSDRICPDFDSAITAEYFLLQIILPWMKEQWQIGERQIAACGISMGGQGAIRLGLKYPKHFPVVAGVASAFDYHERYGNGLQIDQMYKSKEACRQDTAALHASPIQFPPAIWFNCDLTDEWHRGNDRLHEKLSAIGISHTCDLSTINGGHSWQYFDAMAKPMVDFCMLALEKESRRLV